MMYADYSELFIRFKLLIRRWNLSSYPEKAFEVCASVLEGSYKPRQLGNARACRALSCRILSCIAPYTLLSVGDGSSVGNQGNSGNDVFSETYKWDPSEMNDSAFAV